MILVQMRNHLSIAALLVRNMVLNHARRRWSTVDQPPVMAVRNQWLPFSDLPPLTSTFSARTSMRRSISMKNNCGTFSFMLSQEVAVSYPWGKRKGFPLLPLQLASSNCLSSGLKPAWNDTKNYKKALRDFVALGGRYAGFCVGAYLAGSNPAFGSPGFDILPPSSVTGEKVVQPGAQVKNAQNTIIQVNWQFQTGPEKGELQDGRWLFFQDGAVIKLLRNASAIILGRYSSNNNIAASLIPFGNGWVGFVGPHPEADES